MVRVSLENLTGSLALHVVQLGEDFRIEPMQAAICSHEQLVADGAEAEELQIQLVEDTRELFRVGPSDIQAVAGREDEPVLPMYEIIDVGEIESGVCEHYCVIKS